jgi:hypothetical protein
MKKLLLIVGMVFCLESKAQNEFTKVDSMCLERGHVLGEGGFTTSMYCPPYTIDTDSTTVTVYPACNSATSACSRCNKYVSVPEKEYRVVTWRKPKK